MQITTNTDHEAEAQNLVALADTYGIGSVDLLFDIYNVFANEGASIDHDANMLEALRDSDPTRYWVERDQYHRQVVVIGQIHGNPLFESLMHLPPLKATEEVIKLVKESWDRWQAANADAKDGYGWNSNPAAVTGDLSDEYNREENAQQWIKDHRSQLDGEFADSFDVTNMLDLMAGLFGSFQNPLAFSLFSHGCFPYSLLRNQKMDQGAANAILRAAHNFANKGGAFFWNWIANLGNKAGFESVQDVRTDDVTADVDSDMMESMEDLVSANPADIEAPDFDKKVQERNIVVEKHNASEEDKAHCVVLIDVSGSMATTDCGGNRLDRSMYVWIVVLSMIDKVVSRGDEIHLIFFEDSPSKMISITNQQEAIDAAQAMLNLSRYGGGTNLTRALHRGIEKVQEVGTYRHADIVIITDGEDHVDVQDIKNRMPANTKLRGIHVGDDVSPDSREQFIEMCDAAVCGKWDLQEDCPAIDDVLKGV